jgi:hypothetical protein
MLDVSTYGVNSQLGDTMLVSINGSCYLGRPEDEMARRKDTDVVNLRLRLPEALRKQLDVAAEKSNRSLNSEILWRLGQTFGKEWMEFVGEMEQQERDDQERLERFMNNPEARAGLQKIIADHFAKHPQDRPPKKKDR